MMPLLGEVLNPAQMQRLKRALTESLLGFGSEWYPSPTAQQTSIHLQAIGTSLSLQLPGTQYRICNVNHQERVTLCDQ